MHEIVTNLHMHTQYSDGTGTHEEIVQAALDANLDVVITTDHNVWVSGIEGYFKDRDRQVLLLIGEEVHDPGREPQANHLLVFGAGMEVAKEAQDPQQLIDFVEQQGGLSFLAHPFETDAPAFGEPNLSWVDWQVNGFTGLEIWNAMSEFKSLLRTRLHAFYYAFNPRQIATGPPEETMRKWDALLAEGRQVVAIGGSDAHAFHFKIGPFRKKIFPYSFHFRAVNTHLLLSEALSGNPELDRRLVYEALETGRAFVANDLLAPARGFRFTAQGKESRALMGEAISTINGVTLQVRLPQKADCTLYKNGQEVKSWSQRENCTHITKEPGAYRVEAYLHYLRRRRGWIYSNPIYLHPPD